MVTCVAFLPSVFLLLWQGCSPSVVVSFHVRPILTVIHHYCGACFLSCFFLLRKMLKKIEKSVQGSYTGIGTRTRPPRKTGIHQHLMHCRDVCTRVMADFGQSNFGQSIFMWLCCCCVVVVLLLCWWFGPFPPDAEPPVRDPSAGPPSAGPPKISLFFFPSPAPICAFFFSLSLSGGPLVEFWWCLKRRDPQMCTFGVLGLSCEAPAA